MKYSDRIRLGVLSIIAAAWIGCDRASNTQPPSTGSRPSVEQAAADLRSEFATTVANGNWSQAWQMRSSILIQCPDDADLRVQLARAAFETGNETESFDLLEEATRMSPNAQRITLAVQMMVAGGRLFRAIELLRDLSPAVGDDGESKKMLADFLIGTEQHSEARRLAREMVIARQFDSSTLQILSLRGQRKIESDSLQKMVDRYPADRRPLIGKARHAFDNRELDDCRVELDAILEQHPGFVPAWLLAGRCLADAESSDRLQSWIRDCPIQARQSSDYWLTVGDWAASSSSASSSSSDLAAYAYWFAVEIDPDDPEAMRKLNSRIDDLFGLPDSVVQAVRDRHSQLAKLNQATQQFFYGSSQTPQDVMEISQALSRLGRKWEAEAWLTLSLSGRLAIGSITEETRTELETLRRRILSDVNRQTPWQSAWLPESRLSEFQLAESRSAESTLPIRKPQDLLDRLLPQLSNAPVARQTKRPFVASKIPIVLTNEAKRRGLEFYGRTAEDLDQANIRLHETLGCGGGTIDYDLDGWPDLVFADAGGVPGRNDSRPNALFRNVAGQFDRIEAVVGIEDREFGQGVSVGDVNDDGFADLLCLNYGRNHLYLNQGDGTFVACQRFERANQHDAGSKATDGWQNHGRWSTSGAIADLNSDGFMDIFVACYCRGLEPSTVDCGGDAKTGNACAPTFFPAQPDYWMEQLSNGEFLRHELPTTEIAGRGLGVVAGDWSGTGGMAVYVANDMTANHLWQFDASEVGANESSVGRPVKKGQPVEKALLTGVDADDRSQPQGSMGIAILDVDSDQRPDFYVTNFSNEYNSLYVSAGASAWEDETVRFRLGAPTMPMVGFGTQAVDFDADGHDELIVTNGHVDFFSRDNRRAIYYQPLQIFRQTGSIQFDVVQPAGTSTYHDELHCGRALWLIDANRDHLLDVVVTHQTEPVALLINETATSHRRLAVRLVGTSSSRDAVGSTITVRVGDHVQTRWVTSGDGYLASNQKTSCFGFASSDNPIDVHVRWPDGSESNYPDLPANSSILLIQHQDAAWVDQDTM